jgi:hypothetical protein
MDKLKQKRRKRKARALQRKLEEDALQRQRDEEGQNAASKIQKSFRGSLSRKVFDEEKRRLAQVQLFLLLLLRSTASYSILVSGGCKQENTNGISWKKRTCYIPRSGE